MKKIIFIISLLGTFITINAQEYVQSKTFIPSNNANNAIGEKNAIWRNNVIAPPAGNNFPNLQNWWSIFQTQFNDTRYDAQLAFGLNRQDLWLRYNYDGNWEKWKQIILADHNGNVGIGTTNPTEKLQITGKIFLNSGPDDDGIYWARHNMTMGTIPGSYNHNVFMLKPGGASNGFLFSKFEMYTADSETEKTKKVQIHSYGTSFFNGGNVGIGTEDTKGYKLGVKGKIAAEEVKVALYNAWPDYVFESDYNLPTLQQVENHIAENGHLEDIPSAAAVKENGIQLGEMNAKLLQKIEELTLYMIEQNKINEQQQRQIKVLKKEIEKLKIK